MAGKISLENQLPMDTEGFSILPEPRPAVIDGTGSTLLPSPVETWEATPPQDRHLITPKGGTVVVRDPIGPVQQGGPRVYLEFAALRGAPPDALVAFANRYGLLGWSVNDGACRGGERLRFWRDQIENIASLVDEWARDSIEGSPRLDNVRNALLKRLEVDIGRLNGVLVWRGDSPSVLVRPRTLLSAMWMEMAMALSAGALLRRCDLCDCIFLVGPRSLGARPSSARYCSEACAGEHYRGQLQEARDASGVKARLGARKPVRPKRARRGG